MPCSTSDGMGSGYSDVSRSDLRQLEQKLADTDAMLCALLRILAADGNLDNMISKIDPQVSGILGSQVKDWWAKHQARDKKLGY